MAWVYLIVAGGLETLWATTMQLSEGFTKLGYSLLTLGVMAASELEFHFLFLSFAPPPGRDPIPLPGGGVL